VNSFTHSLPDVCPTYAENYAYMPVLVYKLWGTGHAWAHK